MPSVAHECERVEEIVGRTLHPAKVFNFGFGFFGETFRVADKTGFMYVDTTQGGRTGYLVEYGPTAQIFDDPQEKFTKDYIKGEFS